MITVDNLTVRLGGRDILRGLNMHLTQGAIHGIAGINGAGKTTLLRTLYGLLRPASGSVSRNGRPLNRREMVLLETEVPLYEGMTGRDLLVFFRMDNTEMRLLAHSDRQLQRGSNFAVRVRPGQLCVFGADGKNLAKV